MTKTTDTLKDGSLQTADGSQKNSPMGRKRKAVDTSTYSGRFAVRLRELRDKQGLTTRELSEKTGIPKSTIESWDSGTNIPHLDKFPAIAKALKTTPKNLLPKE